MSIPKGVELNKTALSVVIALEQELSEMFKDFNYQVVVHTDSTASAIEIEELKREGKRVFLLLVEGHNDDGEGYLAFIDATHTEENVLVLFNHHHCEIRCAWQIATVVKVGNYIFYEAGLYSFCSGKVPNPPCRNFVVTDV